MQWSKDLRFENAAFIAVAREALPYWLQRVRELEEFLKRVAEAPFQAQEIMRRNGLAIRNLDDPMEKLAFTLYTMLAELAQVARDMLGEAGNDATDA